MAKNQLKAEAGAEILLKASAVTIKFGGLVAVADFNLQLRQGELVGLIGPNGAGKTTIFNLLTGVYQPSSGVIELLGKSTAGVKPFELSQHGIARTFQNIRLFKGLSVLDNIRIAAHQHLHYKLPEGLLLSKRFKKEEKEIIGRAMELLKIFNLEDRAREISSSLPYGEQRRLEILRALATSPQVLLLDEPAAGMNHSETHQLMETIAHIRKQFKVTILLIEHDMKLVMGICERILVLDHGVVICEGSPQKVQKDPRVIEAYLGSAANAETAVASTTVIP